MDYEENNVDEIVNAAATADDLLSDEVVEEAEEPAETLESLTEGEEEEQPAEEPKQEQKGTTEPGYVQKRIDKALAKQKETIRAELMSEIAAQMEAKYAPIMDRLLEMDAQELVRKGEVKNLELAKELLRYRQGNPAPQDKPAVTAEQPRQADGRFAPKQDPTVTARIDVLAYQADKLKARDGIDYIEEMNKDKTVKDKILSGKMDFYDLADQLKGGKPGRKPPAPTRSSNGASGQTPNAIENMTDEQFARMERKIAEGARYTLR